MVPVQVGYGHKHGKIARLIIRRGLERAVAAPEENAHRVAVHVGRHQIEFAVAIEIAASRPNRRIMSLRALRRKEGAVTLSGQQPEMIFAPTHGHQVEFAIAVEIARNQAAGLESHRLAGHWLEGRGTASQQDAKTVTLEGVGEHQVGFAIGIEIGGDHPAWPAGDGQNPHCLKLPIALAEVNPNGAGVVVQGEVQVPVAVPVADGQLVAGDQTVRFCVGGAERTIAVVEQDDRPTREVTSDCQVHVAIGVEVACHNRNRHPADRIIHGGSKADRRCRHGRFSASRPDPGTDD